MASEADVDRQHRRPAACTSPRPCSPARRWPSGARGRGPGYGGRSTRARSGADGPPDRSVRRARAAAVGALRHAARPGRGAGGQGPRAVHKPEIPRASLSAASRRSTRPFTKRSPTHLTSWSCAAGPIREQWEARGPGLLAELGPADRSGDLLPSSGRRDSGAPSAGRRWRGASHCTTRVRLEAVLANPFGELPEVARLAGSWRN